MISVDGSNTLRILPSAVVSPRKIRALVCFITCLTSGTIASSSWRKPSSASCCRTFLARFVPPAISLEPLCLSYHSAGRIEQLAIGSMEPVPALLGPGARRPGDVQDPQLHAATAVAQFGASFAGDLSNPFH